MNDLLQLISMSSILFSPVCYSPVGFCNISLIEEAHKLLLSKPSICGTKELGARKSCVKASPVVSLCDMPPSPLKLDEEKSFYLCKMVLTQLFHSFLRLVKDRKAVQLSEKSVINVI
jgi:hypothetical protein